MKRFKSIRFTDYEYRMLLDLFMVSDPWPLTDEQNEVLLDMLNDEAEARGYAEWSEAYHEVKT